MAPYWIHRFVISYWCSTARMQWPRLGLFQHWLRYWLNRPNSYCDTHILVVGSNPIALLLSTLAERKRNPDSKISVALRQHPDSFDYSTWNSGVLLKSLCTALPSTCDALHMKDTSPEGAFNELVRANFSDKHTIYLGPWQLAENLILPTPTHIHIQGQTPSLAYLTSAPQVSAPKDATHTLTDNPLHLLNLAPYLTVVSSFFTPPPRYTPKKDGSLWVHTPRIVDTDTLFDAWRQKHQQNTPPTSAPLTGEALSMHLAVQRFELSHSFLLHLLSPLSATEDTQRTSARTPQDPSVNSNSVRAHKI